VTGLPERFVAGIPYVYGLVHRAEGFDKSTQVLLMLAAQFGVLVVVSLVTASQPAAKLDPFFARLHTPVGRESEFAAIETPGLFTEEASLGLYGPALDYQKSSQFAYAGLQKLGIEVPRLSLADWGGFLLAWVTVGGLIALLVWLASLGR
jgi:hypothetical protein